MTVTVKDQSQLLIPPSVQRRAGIKAGDRVEFKVSGGVITIVAKPEAVDDEYTPEQRRIIDAELAESDADVAAGRVYGPFSLEEATKLLRKEMKTPAKNPRA